MTRENRPISARSIVVLTLALLAAGVLVQWGWFGRQAEEAQRLQDERVRLLSQQRQMQDRAREDVRLKEYFGLEGEQGDGASETEPLAYVARELAASRLERLELQTVSVVESGSPQRTRFFVRARGSYTRIHGFIRRLEASRRVVTIDALRIEPLPDGSSLELRVELTVFGQPGGD